MLKNIKLFILDMDGTIYLEDTRFEGTNPFLNTLKSKDVDVVFLTNNSSRNVESYYQKFLRLSIPVKKKQIYTSGKATALYLLKQKKHPKVYLLGTQDLADEFNNLNIKIVNETYDYPDFVVLGFDTTLSYDKIHKASDYIIAGVPFIATHPDLVCPLKDGKSMPDTGAMIKMFEACTNVSPIIIGKPHQPMVETVLSDFNYKKDEVCVVGDRLYTDIQMAINAGLKSVLVLSGETTQSLLSKQDITPNFVVNTIKDIIDLL